VVQAVIAAGFRVIPLPGPSAVITALMATGVTTDASPGFIFAGFAPTKSMARQRWLRQWSALPAALVFYEAPHRITASIQDLLGVAGPDRRVAFARELTKRFEEIATMPLSQAQAWFEQDKHREQGEYVVILYPPDAIQDQETESDQTAGIDAWLVALLETMSVRDIARVAAKATGQSRDALYARVLALKSKHQLGQ